MKYERYTKVELLNNKSYTFDKNIFSISILILLCIFFIILFSNGGLSTEKNFYVNCDVSKGWGFPYCENPFYLNYPICNEVWDGACTQQLLENGFVYGTPPPRYFLYFNYAIFMLLVSAFVINHLVHNRHLKLADIKFKQLEAE